MTILIVDALAANEGRRKFSRDAIGVGPRLLAGICEKNNKKTEIVRVEDILSNNFLLSTNEYEAFLISGMSVDKISVKKVIKRISTTFSNCKIILGGPLVSETDIIDNKNILCGVIGEGEIILDKLLKNNFSIQTLVNDQTNLFESNKIGHYWIIKQKQLSSSTIFKEFPASTERISDYPDYWFSKVYVEITRGCSNFYRGSLVKSEGGCSDCGNCEDPDKITTGNCPQNIPPGCGFCSVPATFGPPRSKPKELVIKEITELFSKGVRRIILSSPGFFDYFRGGMDTIYSPTIPPANLTIITELLSALANLRDAQKDVCSISIENVKPSLVTQDAVQIIGKYLPRTAISIGCETFEVEHSSAIGRPATSKQALLAAKFFRNEGIDTQIYLIHSLPGETVKSLRVTREVINSELRNYVEKITIYKYLPLPNSPFTKTKVVLPTERHLLIEERNALKQDIINFNKLKKRELIGKKLEVIIAEKDFQHENHYIAYPIFSGPTVSVYSEEDIRGQTMDVKINDVITDRLVKGSVTL